MKSFPSTFNTGGINMHQTHRTAMHKDAVSDYYTTGRGDAVSREGWPDISRIKSMNMSASPAVAEQLLHEEAVDTGRNRAFARQAEMYRPQFDPDYADMTGSGKPLEYESPFTMPAAVIRSMNNYRFIYNKPTKALIDVTKKGNGKMVHVAGIASTPALFNPQFNIQSIGITDNVPLMNNISNLSRYDNNITDCSIKELVRLSHLPQSILGLARYKYADFMYCAELGRIPNNHLITLRKFPYPVGDNIFETAGPKYRKGSRNFDSVGDYARMVTWFGTDDNKLEDILKYTTKATWKELHAEIQQLDSREDNSGSLLNQGITSFGGMSSTYAAGMGAGMYGNQNLFQKLGYNMTSKFLGATGAGKAGIDTNASSMGDNKELLRNYDQNKVYTPKDTIQDTYTYEGKLQFTNDFTLTFHYKMRAYDNINTKTAMLDLLGNIQECTYRRGVFWGGQQKLIGPPQNTSAWRTANAFIDNSWSKLGGIMQAFGSGSFSLDNILGALSSLSNAASGLAQNALQGAKDFAANGLSGAIQSVKTGLNKWNKVTHFSEAMKAGLKNSLGRPQLYAFNSLLSGDNVGLWHVTVGNPKNPIAVMGNMIVDSTEITHLGPLGIDDFPTEIKVTVHLKHARPRDITDIGRMYTKGHGSIYYPAGRNSINDFVDLDANTMRDLETIEKAQAAVRAESAKEDTAYMNQQQEEAAKAAKAADEASKTPEATGGAKPAAAATPAKDTNTANTKPSPDYSDSKASQALYAAQEAAMAAADDANMKLMSTDAFADYNPVGHLDNTDFAWRIEQTGQDRPVAWRMVLDEIS